MTKVIPVQSKVAIDGGAGSRDSPKFGRCCFKVIFLFHFGKLEMRIVILKCP